MMKQKQPSAEELKALIKENVEEVSITVRRYDRMEIRCRSKDADVIADALLVSGFVFRRNHPVSDDKQVLSLDLSTCVLTADRPIT